MPASDWGLLQRAIRQTVPDCFGSPSRPSSGEPCLKKIAIDTRDDRATDAPQLPRHDDTVDAPLSPRPGETVVAPLSPRPDETVVAPLSPRPGETVVAPLSPRPEETVVAPLSPRQHETVVAPPHRGPDQVTSDREAEPDQTRADRGETQHVPIDDPAADASAPRSVGRSRHRVAEVAQVLVILFGIVLALRASVQTFRVDGPSMLPNFETGEDLIVNRIALWHIDGTPFEGLLPVQRQGSIEYLFGGPRRGDVVVLRPPSESGFPADLIKRVIGLPGDVISIQDGQVFVNGDALDEPYVQFPADYTFPGPDTAVQVPDGSYFVLGDNRPVSGDSHLGWFVPMQNIVGEAWICYWPAKCWGLVHHADLSQATSDELPEQF